MKETRWVIIGNAGLYIGQWQTRKDAIAEHCEQKGFSWARCRRNGDRAIKAFIEWKRQP